MKFSIIVPAFNEAVCLPATLSAIERAAAQSDCEVIVVDNASTDRTCAIALEHGALVVREEVHNIGRVRNTGARAAIADVLVFVDADTLVPPSFLSVITAAMQRSECMGGAVAVDYTRFARRWMKWYLKGWTFWGRLFNMKQGAAQFCRKTVFDELGGYEETIYMGEDIHFYWRLAHHARQHGGTLSFVESPKVVTSSRRFDKMGVPRTLALTHPLIIWLAWKRRSMWKDWYERPIR